jgi:hypothetical protein
LANAITKQLSLNHPKLFKNITRGVIYKWLDKEVKQGWSTTTKKILSTDTDAIDCSFDFAFAKSTERTSHFSTMKTVKEVISLVQ